MIPKIIHWCWFGRNPVPEEVRRYVDHWKEISPDWKIICWDENNFDITENDYCREAYEQKKWAFVSDFARLKVLYDYGGFYLDSDVEMVKPFDDLLPYCAVSGFQNKKDIPTGTMGAEPHNEWIGQLLHDYDNRHFILPDGSLDLTTNVTRITQLTIEKYGLELKGEITEFSDGMVLFPVDYFCAYDAITDTVSKTKNTYTVHHFCGSWQSESEKRNKAFRACLKKKLGSRLGLGIYRIYYYIFVHKVGHIVHAWNKHIRGHRLDRH